MQYIKREKKEKNHITFTIDPEKAFKQNQSPIHYANFQ